MRCGEAMERLVEAATGSVPPSAREGLVAHLTTCESCRREAAALEGTAALLRSAGRFATPPGFWSEFTDRLHARVAVERLPAVERLRRWLGRPRHAAGTAAVTAALVLAVVVGIWLGPGPAPTVERADPLDARLRGMVTETMSATLPSLSESLDTWRAGLHADTDPEVERP
jgi:anti-sigma factor RsiW